MGMRILKWVGPRLLVLFGGSLICGGMYLCNFYAYIWSQGLMLGCGMGLLYMVGFHCSYYYTTGPSSKGFIKFILTLAHGVGAGGVAFGWLYWAKVDPSISAKVPTLGG